MFDEPALVETPHPPHPIHVVLALILGTVVSSVVFGGMAASGWLYLRHAHNAAPFSHAQVVIALAAGCGAVVGFVITAKSILEVKSERSAPGGTSQ